MILGEAQVLSLPMAQNIQQLSMAFLEDSFVGLFFVLEGVDVNRVPLLGCLRSRSRSILRVIPRTCALVCSLSLGVYEFEVELEWLTGDPRWFCTLHICYLVTRQYILKTRISKMLVPYPFHIPSIHLHPPSSTSQLCTPHSYSHHCFWESFMAGFLVFM